MTCRLWYRSVARANATECATVGFYASAPALEFSDNDNARTMKHLTLAGHRCVYCGAKARSSLPRRRSFTTHIPMVHHSRMVPVTPIQELTPTSGLAGAWERTTSSMASLDAETVLVWGRPLTGQPTFNHLKFWIDINWRL